ncbi:Ku protein [Sporomusa sphaeroides DSM 2875]|uniref:non-homologous end joining protein Ku n=1 Tax=Sporomusa sphaeroides TaxID=47679 RepID=UPI0020305264|nr:Ku protein [Sporomusa sphaeroides]MCM0758124.1 Ku protein [Sporomusa sphaeroides DSM 2875]
MRPIWKGMLSFGLVNVPVALYPATKKKTISFNQLRKSDYSRINYKKVGTDGAEVRTDEIVKGYQISPDRYVIIEDSDINAITPAASRVIEINDFVKLDQIDPRHYDASYYLVPETGAGKAYALLLQAMGEANVVGIAKFVLRSKEYLAAIRPAEGALTLSTMLFADEIVPAAALETYLPGDIKLSDKELNMARQLIASLITNFEPEKYENEYYKAVTKLIDSKAETAIGTKQAEPPGKVIDIMAALEASIAAIKAQEKSKRKKKTG